MGFPVGALPLVLAANAEESGVVLRELKTQVEPGETQEKANSGKLARQA